MFHRFPSLVCMMVILVAAAAAATGQKDPETETETETQTAAERMKEDLWWRKLVSLLPPSVTILPPGQGLCKKHLPRNQCAIRPGGGRGVSQIASRSLVRRLWNRGWTKTRRLPTHVNAIHFCCNGKIFAMERKPKKPTRVGPPPPLPFDKGKFDTATVAEGEGEGTGWQRTPSYVTEIHGQLGLQDLLDMSYEAGPVEPVVTQHDIDKISLSNTISGPSLMADEVNE